jgi:hypothetical protein
VHSANQLRMHAVLREVIKFVPPLKPVNVDLTGNLGIDCGAHGNHEVGMPVGIFMGMISLAIV